MEDSEEVLQNSNPAILVSFFQEVSDLFANYGWYIFISCIAILYAYVKSYPNIKRYFDRKAEEEYAAKYHKNPDLMRSRLCSIDEARQKMQEQHNQQVEEFKIKSQLKEERKRQEFLDKHSGTNTSGIKLGRKENVKDEDNEKKSFKQDYNPLMGGASGSSYRAPKRSTCGGGGCGK